MSIRPNRSRELSEVEIDDIVEQQADDDTAWEAPIAVNRQTAFLVLPEEIVEKASFFTNLHNADTIESWLVQVIRLRVALKRTLSARLRLKK
ncbi:hypothetical protein PN498_21440 [Oscillatoria sp. CS-180]|uniref:hypothetical protein n=1 Tax=Oscillatoria sp. CS-180 TaxID=3021720 RepID=UPI00232B85D6|nr:hypothetical protein [Oscillatoria sp. CS-180]MDB9528571.1 hypothetical protein [Oscillatoria sp. CS-180]